MTAASVIVVAIIVGGGAYYLGGSTVAPKTSTVTDNITMTQTATATQTTTAFQTLAQFSATCGIATAGGAALYYATNDPSITPFYTQKGLAEKCITSPAETAPTLKNFIANGTVMGFASSQDVLVARATGTPVKLIGVTTGSANTFVATLPGSTITTMAQLNGQKVGSTAVSAATISAADRNFLYMENKSGIQATTVYLGSGSTAATPAQEFAALQAGTVVAIVTSDAGLYSMVAAGQLKVVAYARDLLPSPWAANGIWATDSIIQSNPALVQAFVTATLQTVNYLNQNPSYAISVYAQGAGISTATATAGLSLVQWTPNGGGGSGSAGSGLLAAATNIYNVGLATGSIPAGTTLNVASAINTSFLGP